MTCIVGYKNKLGELFLAADSRISWTFNDPSRQVVHIDELQKLYFPAPNIAIALAGNNIFSIQKVMEQFKNSAVNIIPVNDSDSKSMYKYNNSITRILEKCIVGIKEMTELIVGVSFPSNPKYNKLYFYRIQNSKIVCNREILGGDYHIAGSVTNEKDYEKFETDVIKGAFKLKYPVGISFNNNVFHSGNVLFQSRMQTRWDSVGELFCSTYTVDGEFIGVSTDIIGFSKNDTMKIIIEYDEKNKNYMQINVKDKKIIRLLPLDKYNFEVYPDNDKEFRVFKRE